MNELAEYTEKVIDQIWDYFSEREKAIFQSDKSKIRQFIETEKNEHGEYDNPFYPVIKDTVEALWEENNSVEQAATKLVNGIRKVGKNVMPHI